MAIVNTIWKTFLGSAPSPAELSVVREDRKAEFLFSMVEAQGAVKRRVTFTLTDRQAIDLARFLAGVTHLQPTERPFEDEETDPTKPGRST